MTSESGKVNAFMAGKMVAGISTSETLHFWGTEGPAWFAHWGMGKESGSNILPLVLHSFPRFGFGTPIPAALTIKMDECCDDFMRRLLGRRSAAEG